MADLITARGLGKKYRIGGFAHNVLREQLAATIRKFLRGATPDAAGKEFWALRDVDLDIADGEVVGLVGKNGAGKSTLLKLLSRITEPSEGEAHIRGRVASLLEVGVGFHPELTGRENIFLNGAILGMSRSEIRRKFDDIVAFSEVERFLDTPVKRYSSGMYVRLAFAVAAHLDPEILIVDEVLAVGDAAFQRKCLGKMKAISAQGRTVLVVSHNMSTVTSLCTRAIWLENGSVRASGRAQDIVTRYLSEGVQNDLVWSPRHPRISPLEFHTVGVQAAGDPSPDAFKASTPIVLEFDLTIHDAFVPGHIEARLHNEMGEALFTTSSADGSGHFNHAWSLGRQQLRCQIPGYFLMPGRYSLTITEPYGAYDILREAVVSFTVSEEGALLGERPGKIAPLLKWETQPGRPS